MTMVDCKDVLANLSSYMDGEASAELRASLEDHIAKCRRCRVVFDTTQKSMSIILDAEPFEVPLAVSARLYARLEAELSGR